MPNRRQIIIWANADPIHWRIYAALGRDQLKRIIVRSRKVSKLLDWMLKLSHRFKISQMAHQQQLLFKRPTNFRAHGQLLTIISRLRDITRYYDNESPRLVNKGRGSSLLSVWYVGTNYNGVCRPKMLLTKTVLVWWGIILRTVSFVTARPEQKSRHFASDIS